MTIAAETGVAGLLALLALVAATLATLAAAALRRRSSPLGLAAAVLLASQAAVFAIGLQTEVWGIPWLVYVLWFLTGSVVTGHAAPEAVARIRREVPDSFDRQLGDRVNKRLKSPWPKRKKPAAPSLQALEDG